MRAHRVPPVLAGENVRQSQVEDEPTTLETSGPLGMQAVENLIYTIVERPTNFMLLVLSKICCFYVIVSTCWIIFTFLVGASGAGVAAPPLIIVEDRQLVVLAAHITTTIRRLVNA